MEARTDSPFLWHRGHPQWLRAQGKTLVLVVDDQIQANARLCDPDQLEKRVLDPFNIEFIYCSACAEGGDLAKQGRWIESALNLVEKHRDRLAAIFVDLMFEGEDIPIEGSGIAFLRELYRARCDIPLAVLTQASWERSLDRAMEEVAAPQAFLSKDSDDRVAEIAGFLERNSWTSCPGFEALSLAMRRQLHELRSLPQRLPRNEKNLLLPLMFVAPSGEGKTTAAEVTANWLARLGPPMRTTTVIENLDCNAFNESQAARIKLFGRGRTQPDEGPMGEIIQQGVAQRADGGIVIADEVGGSPRQFQNLLLALIDEGRSHPEFLTEVFGPHDILWIFTAQPRHFEQGLWLEDLYRRVRGPEIKIPPLAERSQDVLPVFRAALRERHPELEDPDHLDGLLLGDAQRFLLEVVQERRVTASQLADIAGEIDRIGIGKPRLETLFAKLIPTKSTVKLTSPGEPSAPTSETEPPVPGGPLEIARLVAQILGTDIRVDRSRDALLGQLPVVRSAAARIVLTFLEAAAAAARGSGNAENVTGTYKIAADRNVGTIEARKELAKLLEFSLEETAAFARRSDEIAALIVDVAKRAKSMEHLLNTLEEEGGEAAERIKRLRETRDWKR